MKTCHDCNDDILNPQPSLDLPYCIECAAENDKCIVKFPAECVIYHNDNDTPSQLTNLGVTNRTSLSSILETIDTFIGGQFNVELILVNTNTVTLSHPHSVKSLSAEVNISQAIGNHIQKKTDGLYVGVDADIDGKVKISSTDTLGYLGNKTVGGTDGIVSLSLIETNNILQALPTLDITALLNKINDTPTLKDLFCQIVGNC